MNLTYLPSDQYFQRPQTKVIEAKCNALTIDEFDAQAKTENIPDDAIKYQCIRSAVRMAQEFIKSSIESRVLSTYWECVHGTNELPYGATGILSVLTPEGDQVPYEAKGLTNLYLTFPYFADSVIVTYRSGYEDGYAVPQDIKTAMLKIAVDLYENRGDSKVLDAENISGPTWIESRRLLKPYRIAPII